jgi:protocatechuate 3,4-dioxygenase, alpha subunit
MSTRTPSQTIGPFFHEALRWRDGARCNFREPGEKAVITGRVIDGAGQPVGDAMLETWQLDAQGATPKPASGDANPYGFTRFETAKDGTFRIETQVPGGSAPFLDVTIFARGLLKHLRTRVYLAPEAQVRADAALQAIAGSPRISTLVAQRVGNEWRWDVHLQGDGETVFFAA